MIQGLHLKIERQAINAQRIEKPMDMPEYDCVNIYIREHHVDETYYRDFVENEMVANGEDLGEKDWMCYIVEKVLHEIPGFDEYVLSMIVDPHIIYASMMIGRTEVLITKNRLVNY